MTLYAITTAEKMKSVKARCDKAPFGEKRATAMKHFHAAETAHTAMDDAKANRELNAAKHALE